MPRSDSVGPEVIALGRVVVDDVQNHFDPGCVQIADHRLELAHRSGRLCSSSSGCRARRRRSVL